MRAECRPKLLWLGVLCVLGLSVGCSSPVPADRIFVAARVHTLAETPAEADTVATRNGVIVYVGNESGVAPWIGPKTERVDLAGATIVPGLTDSHVHLSGVGAQSMNLDLKGVRSVAELVARLRDRIEETPKGEWVLGRGWIETFWTPARFPTRSDLDIVSPDHPVFLWRVDGHGGVANSLALQLAGIDVATKDPNGGQILRDAEGRPTGMLLDHAQDAVLAHAEGPSDATVREQLVRGAEIYARLGWTAVQIAGTSWREMEILRELVDAGTIPLRVYCAINGPGSAATLLFERGITGARPHARFTCRGIKIHYDGALGSGGAALLEPYSDRAGTGLLLHERAELMELFLEALRRGIQIEVHCIGDRANRNILDLFEEAFEAVPAAERAIRDPRWRIEHAQILAPDDVPRFAALGVIPSMQPSHAITDLHFAGSRLGSERLRGAYAWRALVDSGCQIAGGTDAPVESGNPILEFYAASVRKDPRRDPAGFHGEGWHRDQRLSRTEALRMFTTWAANAAFQDNWRGTIEVGNACDLTVLSRDILQVPEQQIMGTRCVMTIVGGQVAFDGRAVEGN